MDFEAPDGSQVSCREVWRDHQGQVEFDYTTINAYMGGIPYAAKSDQRAEEIDMADAFGSLEPVPLACVQPTMPDNFTVVQEVDAENHYLKAPSFTYDDCRPGATFVADCVRNEASILEQLRQHPHKSIVKYYGCVVKDGRISHICLKRYPWSLPDYVENEHRFQTADSGRPVKALLDDIAAAIGHLHSLGLAHNDINADNVCVDEHGHAILIDFDSCAPFGTRLMKGVRKTSSSDPEVATSNRENDFRGLNDIEQLLCIKEVLWSRLRTSAAMDSASDSWSGSDSSQIDR